jgi:catechol 2,3-dioxygenase-like lactoylglutathione lyase family enzyme
MNRISVYARAIGLFVAGAVFGSLVLRPSAAQEKKNTNLHVNHVGIAVKDVDATVAYYTKVMGYRVAFKFPSPDGKPTTTYMQVSRDTFLEIAPASDALPAGTITHMGVQSDDVKTAVAQIRANGGDVQDVRVSGPTKALLSNINDPNGIRTELVEITPDSLHQQAINRWK